MAKQVSTTYGEALFELAVEEDQIDAFYEEAKGLYDVFIRDQDLNLFLGHPKVLKEDKTAMIQKVFTGRVHEQLVGFLTIIIKKDRQKDIPAILEYFIKRVKDHKKIGVANVTSAITLFDAKKQQIEARLLETTDYNSMEVHYEVDASLIGGLVIRIEDRVVDSSIRNQLFMMRQSLMKA